VNVVGSHGRLRIALENRLRMEGEELVVSLDAVQFRLSTFEGVALPDLTTEHLFGEIPCQSTETYNVVKVFDGQKFQGQTILGLDFVGHVGEGLGFPCVVGSVIKFIKKPSWYDEDRLTAFLKEMSFRGFITLEVNETKVVKIFLGIPGLKSFAMRERFGGSLLEFESKPEVAAFRESWAISTIVSSWPFPYNSEESQTGILASIPSFKILKHFYPFSKDVKKDGTFRTADCIIGVATAWEHDLQRLVHRVMTTCENIKAPMKQYRVDLLETIHKKMEKVSPFLV
jgi:hypothetical protein